MKRSAWTPWRARAKRERSTRRSRDRRIAQTNRRRRRSKVNTNSSTRREIGCHDDFLNRKEIRVALTFVCNSTAASRICKRAFNSYQIRSFSFSPSSCVLCTTILPVSRTHMYPLQFLKFLRLINTSLFVLLTLLQLRTAPSNNARSRLSLVRRVYAINRDYWGLSFTRVRVR